MHWVVIVAFVIVVVATVMVLRAPVRRGGLVRTVSDEELFGDDALDLEAAFLAVQADADEARLRLVRLRLEDLRARQEPLRTIRASPGPAVARLGFADGTVILARSASTGDLSAVVRLHHRGGLVVSDVDEISDGVVMRLAASPGRGRCTMIAVGLDQSD